jgi:thioredoxin 1
MKSTLRYAAFAVFAACAGRYGLAQAPASDLATIFAPLVQWRKAVLSGDRVALKTLYSTAPAARVTVPPDQSNPDADVEFWVGFKAQSIGLDILQTTSPQPGVYVVQFQAEIRSGVLPEERQTFYVNEGQAWQQQGSEWRLVVVQRTNAAHLKQPANQDKNIYPADADARAEIKEAELEAAKEHKRVLLVFGANWCYDCHVLDLAFHRPDFAAVMAGYEVVHVDIGPDGKKNSDLAKQFQVPLDKGVPALAVADSAGKVLVSQKNGEFENARAMTPEALLEFLNKWKP